MKEKYSVLGMSCTACSAGIERTLNRIEGVQSVSVSLMGECMTIEYDEGKLSAEKIMQAVEGLGYGIAPYAQAPALRESKKDTLKMRFLLSVCILLPLMFLSMGGMLGLPLPPDGYNYSLAE